MDANSISKIAAAGWLAACLLTHPLRVMAATPAMTMADCDTDIGGIRLPPGFCAAVFADQLGTTRHLAVNRNGDVYVALQSPHSGGEIGRAHV